MPYNWTNCSNPECNGGTLYDKEGRPYLCECIINQNLKLFHNWSEAKQEHFCKVDDLFENPEIFIRISKGQHKPVRLKNFLNWIIENGETLIKNNSRFVFSGFPGRGKTQASLASCIGIASKIPWSQKDSDYKYYFYLSVKSLISSGMLFNSEEKKRLIYKVKNSQMMILDDLGEDLEIPPKMVGGERIQDKRQAEVHDFLKFIADEFEGILFITSNNSKIEQSYIMTDAEKQDPHCVTKVHEPRLHSRLFGDIDKRTNIMIASFISDTDLRDKQENNAITAFLEDLKGGAAI